MKKRKLLVLSVSIILAVMSAACASSKSAADEMSARTLSYQSAAAAPMAAPVPQAEMGLISGKTGGSGGLPALESRKVVERRSLSIETKEFDETLENIFRIVEEAGGYIENQNVSGVSLLERGSYNERRASVTTRIPAEALGGTVALIEKLGNVVSSGSSIDDITDTYFDSKARLDSLSLQEQRLLEILTKAEKLEDVIALESALSDVRYQIESLTASLRRMDNQVSFSYLSLSVMEVVEYKVVEALPKSFSERMGVAWGRSVTKTVSWAQNLILFVIEDGILLLINLAILLAVIVLARKIILRRKAKELKGDKRWFGKAKALRDGESLAQDEENQNERQK